jgi:ribosomal protein S18 acetylase RimI-like enzyme
MDIVYRKLIRGDEHRYRDLYLEALQTFPEFFGNTFEEQSNLPKLPFEETISSGSDDSFIFGGFVGSELIAIAGFKRGDRKKTRHRGELVQVYTRRDFQGRRIGENLVRLTIETAFDLSGVRSIELSMIADNDSARRLYEKMGFETYSVRGDYFRLGERSWSQRFMEVSKEKYLEQRRLSNSHSMPAKIDV